MLWSLRGEIREARDLESIGHKGPEMPCFRIIRKCISMKTASSQGITKVCRL
jgi:hypothetical protein